MLHNLIFSFEIPVRDSEQDNDEGPLLELRFDDIVLI
jgi:hypothetical protein